jgi:hypothetical protein
MPVSPEQQLLCSLMSCYLDVVSSGDVAGEIEKGVDWERVLAAAKTERLGGFVYAMLKQNNLLQEVPAPVVQELEKIYLTYKARNLLLVDELSKLVKIFEQEKIAALIIKGRNCLRLCYPDKGMRGMDDVDIVVRPDAFEDVRALLLSKGYTGAPYDRDCIYAPSGAMFDLHRDAFDQRRIRSRRFYCSWDFDKVWGCADPYSAECQQVRFLAPLDELIVSSIHAAKHSFAGLSHFLDAALLVHHLPSRAGELFLERVELFGGKRALYFVMAFLDNVLGVKLQDFDYEKLLERPAYGGEKNRKPVIASEAKQSHDQGSTVRLPRRCAPRNDRKVFFSPLLSRYERRALNAVMERRQTEIMGTVLPLYEIRGGWRKMLYLLENVFPRPAVMGEIYQNDDKLKILILYPRRFVQTIKKCYRG